MSIIGKIVIPIVAFIVTIGISFAQTFSNTPNDTINLVGAFEDLETLSIQQLNTSSYDITLKWQKVSESVPSLWEASICDNSFCNTSLVDSGQMIPVIPGDYGLLLLHITPHTNYGTATIRYAIWDVANSSMKDTLTYILTVNNTNGIKDSDNDIEISVFPNPIRETINVTTSFQNGFQYLISDNTGREIQRGNAKGHSIAIQTEFLCDGMYYITLLNQNKIVQTKKILVQH